MGLGLAYFLYLARAGRAVEPAIALMVVAGFVKHTMPEYPLAALIWLAMTPAGGQRCARRPWCHPVRRRAGSLRHRLRAGFCHADAHAARHERETHFLRGEPAAMDRTGNPDLGLLGLAEPEGARRALYRHADCAFPCQRTISGSRGGVTYNAYFGVVFASAVAAALAFRGIASTALAKRYSANALQTAIVAVLALRLLLSGQIEPYLVLASPSFRQEYRETAAAMDAEVQRFRSIPGNASCWPMSIPTGRQAFRLRQLLGGPAHREGQVDKRSRAEAVRVRGIRFETVNQRVLFDKKRLF